MTIWMILLVPSALIGVLCAFLIRKKWAVLLAGLVPWLGVFVTLLYNLYVVPTDRMDPSLWPVAQFFGGNLAAFAGVMAYVFTKNLIVREKV